MIELTVQVRDSLGRPTGRTKTFSSSKGEEIERFWRQHKPNTVREKTPKAGTKKNAEGLVKNLIAEAQKLTKLDKGWDGHNGVPANYNNFLLCSRILSSLTDVIRFKPKIVPTSDGRIILHFDNASTDKSLEIEIMDQFSVRYCLWNEKTGQSEEKNITSNHLSEIRDAFVFMMKK